MNFIAKSDGIDLYQHSKYVEEAALEILKQSVDDFKYNKYKNIISIASLLHDIGKCTKSFQKYLLTSKSTKFKYLHNQIGWAFLSKHLIIDDIELILDAVYWHHGVMNNDITNDDILESLNNDDINNMSTGWNKYTRFCNNIPVRSSDSNFNMKMNCASTFWKLRICPNWRSTVLQ